MADANLNPKSLSPTSTDARNWPEEIRAIDVQTGKNRKQNLF